MKTLIATMAVLFTMATAASAGALDRLGNEQVKFAELETCMLGAQLLGHADEIGIDPVELYEVLVAPESNDVLKMMIDYATSEAIKIRDLRNYRVDMNTVHVVI